MLDENRTRIAAELNVAAFQRLMRNEGRPVPDDATALAALHKARCELACQGAVDKKLGAESRRWLSERGMHPGLSVVH